MKVLVTGGAGYIGSHTVQKLLQHGFSPVVFDNLSTGFKVAVPEGVPFVQGDVRDTALALKTLKDHHIEAVIHFAAKLVVPESVAKPLEYYNNNVGGSTSLLEACAQAGIKKFVFSSTAAVYGNPEITPVKEDATPAPLNPYGMSKLMTEKVLQDYGIADEKFRYVVLRYFNVAGAAVDKSNGQRTLNATHLVKVASESAAGKRAHTEIFGTDYPTKDGTGVRDYIHVEDLADAHVRALEYLKKSNPSDIFNVGYGFGFSVREVLTSMKKVSGQNFTVKESPRRAGDASTIVANSTKIQERMGWKPQYQDLDLICGTAFDWEKSL